MLQISYGSGGRDLTTEVVSTSPLFVLGGVALGELFTISVSLGFVRVLLRLEGEGLAGGDGVSAGE